MAIRKILLPLQLTAAAATFSMAVMVARLWGAHLAVLHAAASRDREGAVRDLFERLTAEHGLAVAEARPDVGEATASFATVIGREPDAIVAQPARLADLIVVPHPAGDKDVSSSDALHAVLFDSAKPVLIAPRTASSTIGHRICIGWNGTAESASAVITVLPCRGCTARKLHASFGQKTINGAVHWRRISSSTSPRTTSPSTERRSNR
jgi:hypothetical protein